MKRNKKYVIEYRRKLRNLQHPPEKILRKVDQQEDEIKNWEKRYGFHELQLPFWQPVTDDLPFPTPPY